MILLHLFTGETLNARHITTKSMTDLRDQGSQSSFSDQVETLPELVHYKNMQMQIPSSPTSNTTTLSIDNEKICRICLDEGTETLVAPCKCSGSAKFAHESCLLQWFFKTRRRKCELCLSEVNVKSMGFKPLKKVSLFVLFHHFIIQNCTNKFGRLMLNESHNRVISTRTTMTLSGAVLATRTVVSRGICSLHSFTLNLCKLLDSHLDIFCLTVEIADRFL